MKKLITVIVNNKEYEIAVEPNKTLTQMLREDLELLGTKEGCGTGDCGACIVILDGKPVNSCLVLAVQTNGSEIITIEGLADGEKLHPIQQAFVDTLEFLEDDIEEKIGKRIKIPIDKKGADILLIHNAGEYLSWPENPEAFAIIFEAAELSWTLSSEVMGYDAVNYGLWYDDVQLARVAIKHAQIAKDLGVKKIVVGEMAYEVKVTRQGQTTIPKELRDRYRIKEGDKLLYIDVGGYMVVLPMSKDPLKELQSLRIRDERSIAEIRKEIYRSALKESEERRKRAAR